MIILCTIIIMNVHIGEYKMTQISISEFRKNIKRYSQLVKEEDILVVNNGKPIMRITDPMKDNIARMKSIKGIIKTDKSYEEIKEDKLLDI